ncbi:hypothetical protein GCM10023205_32830 [Yinghuangia aomiensis]|uniref:Leucine Rich repeat-containing protein n=1 Tax=Yinghuangia aomiensis TaxID=676205 RepID=A0ABP9HAY0_9ACTN
MRADPTRYNYARAARGDDLKPPESTVELHLRSLTGVSAGPIPDSALDALEGFWLHLSGPTDFAGLSRVRNLEWLAIASVAEFDVAGLAAALRNATRLRSLNIEAPIEDIRALGALTGLDRLDLSRTRVTDVRPLARLGALRDLSVTDGPLADLSPLADLRLDRLFVYRTRVADLDALAGMPTLQVLGLGGCPVRDLSVVTTLPALHHVNLRGTPITEARKGREALGGLADRHPYVTFDGIPDADAEPARATPSGDSRPTDEILAEFRTTDSFTRRHELMPVLVARRDAAVMEEVIRTQTHVPWSVRGMLLEGGVGDVPFPANPWGVPPDADLDQALSHIWHPVAHLAPRYSVLLRRHTVGLVLMADADGNSALTYLTVVTEDQYASSEPSAWDVGGPRMRLDAVAEPAGGLVLQFPRGTAPRAVDPHEVLPLLGGPVPAPLRALWAVHHQLGCIGGDLSGDVLGFVDDDWDEGLERTGGTPPDRLVRSVGEGDFVSYVLDLDILDAAGHPTVACWAWKDWGLDGHRQFWDWLDSVGVTLALKEW